ncbi:hypothetical protein [Spirillospora sp. CA-294931]|uniref:hypothetical protein n=1 Tax=Spirillospora sp. CA-294931 TaxID=3240042 RepID=UPI003D8CED5B
MPPRSFFFTTSVPSRRPAGDVQHGFVLAAQRQVDAVGRARGVASAPIEQAQDANPQRDGDVQPTPDRR